MEAERPKVPTEWYTILIIAGKEAEYRARPIWCQDGVDTDTNSNTVPGSTRDNGDSSLAHSPDLTRTSRRC